jgi:threonine/homoserine/homoserine lactone efflux protein
MSWSQWLSLGTGVSLGAMSPGPSLAVVVRHSVVAGTRAGVACALTHGCGIFLLGAADGQWIGARSWLSTARVDDTVRYLGAAFLLYLGCRALLSQSYGCL